MNPVIPAPVALAAALVAAVAQIWFWRRTALRGGRRLAALGLRLGAISLLAWILTGPDQPILAKSETRQPLVLVDISRSMDFPGDGGTRAQQAATVVTRLSQNTPAGERLPIQAFGSRLLADASPPADPSVRDASLPATALRTALASSPAGRPPHSILLVSDGAAQDAAELPALAKICRDRGIAISVLCTGATVEMKNAALIGLDAPRRAEAGSLVPVTATARREGMTDPLVLELLTSNGTVVDRATLAQEAAEQSATFNITPGPDGFSGSIRISAIEGETTLADNETPLRIPTGNSKLRVLYMEGSIDSPYGVPEPLILCQALAEDQDIEVDLLCLNAQNTSGGSVLVHWPWKDGPNFRPDRTKSYPVTREELNRYDVIICSDIPRAAFNDDQIQWTVDLVAERGAGFIMIGGNTSFGAGLWDRTPWEKLVPLDMDDSSRGFAYQTFPVFWAATGKQHPLLAQLPLQPGESLDQILEAHPFLLGTNFIHRAKPAATVLMRMEDESGVPIIAVQPFGKGRTMAFTSDITYLWGSEHNRNWGPPDGEPPSQRADPSDPFSPFAASPQGDGSAPFNNSYYRRFWQRAVRWLAENSVRVKGDQFELTTPYLQWPAGQPLPLAAAGPDESLMARLARMPCVAQIRDQPATRLKLTWDEASHRFIGSLPRPATLPEEAVIDVEVRDPLARSTITASLTIRAPRTDPEATDASARPERLAELARTSGGQILHSAADAAAWLKASKEQASSPSATGRKPAWDRPWALAAVLVLLSTEWLLRRLYA